MPRRGFVMYVYHARKAFGSFFLNICCMPHFSAGNKQSQKQTQVNYELHLVNLTSKCGSTSSVRGVALKGLSALILRAKSVAGSIYEDEHVDLRPGDLRALTRKSD